MEDLGPDKNIKELDASGMREATYEETVIYLLSLFSEFVFPATKTMLTEAELLGRSGGFLNMVS